LFIKHAFDSSGRKYDGEGHLTDWWTNETSAKFEESTNCFIDQYSKFNVTGPDNKPVFVNGKVSFTINPGMQYLIDFIVNFR
jgi:endothelin-converting enzyme